MEIKLFNTSAKEVGTMELMDTVFGQEYNEYIIHEVVVAQLANRRQGTKSTLTRSEVRGGGRKPWRQKGTGRARQGSIRSPQWVKGGVVFAPKPRDFSKKVNKKVKLAAIKSALSAKVASNELIVLDEFKINAPKTKEVASVLKAFNLAKRVLIVINGDSDVAIAARNIPNVMTIEADLINVYDVVANANCIMTKSAVEKIQEVYGAC